MFKIDGAGTVPSLPVPLPVGTPGYFGRGNLGTGQRPTTVTADWANILQCELEAVIDAAGIALNKTNNAQLLAALQAMFAPLGSAGFSTDGSGNWKIAYSNGLIEMGGVVSAPRSSEASTSLTFPFGGFPTACLDFSANTINSAASATGVTIIQEVSLNRLAVSLFIQDQSSTFGDVGGGYRWRGKGN